MSFSSKAPDATSYKMSGTDRKGNWIQIKLEDMTESIDSIGILFRRKGVK